MLYVVATPIGNAEEITFRAVETLKSVDAILCEDTRHSRPLLSRLGIEKPLISYQKFNERARCAEILERLKKGESIAVISDAGMPTVSDNYRSAGYGVLKRSLGLHHTYAVFAVVEYQEGVAFLHVLMLREADLLGMPIC